MFRFRRRRHHRNTNPAEDIVDRVLKKLQDEGQIPGFIRNNPNDRLDKEGIDFLIFLRDGLALPLQVKTSSHKRNGKKAHWHFYKHPLVKFLIFVPVHEADVDEKVEQKLKTILKVQPPQ